MACWMPSSIHRSFAQSHLWSLPRCAPHSKLAFNVSLSGTCRHCLWFSLLTPYTILYFSWSLGPNAYPCVNRQLDLRGPLDKLLVYQSCITLSRSLQPLCQGLSPLMPYWPELIVWAELTSSNWSIHLSLFHWPIPLVDPHWLLFGSSLTWES